MTATVSDSTAGITLEEAASVQAQSSDPMGGRLSLWVHPPRPAQLWGWCKQKGVACTGRCKNQAPAQLILSQTCPALVLCGDPPNHALPHARLGPQHRTGAHTHTLTSMHAHACMRTNTHTSTCTHTPTRIAGLEPVVIELLQQGDELCTDVPTIQAAIARLGADRVAVVVTTTSCFAPRWRGVQG